MGWIGGVSSYGVSGWIVCPAFRRESPQGLGKGMLMSSFAATTPEGPGSVSGAPNLPARFPDTFTSRYVTAGDLRQHVVTGGEGPPLLLVHGWPQTWHAWRLVMPALARDFSVVAPDQRARAGRCAAEACPTGRAARAPCAQRSPHCPARPPGTPRRPAPPAPTARTAPVRSAPRCRAGRTVVPATSPAPFSGPHSRPAAIRARHRATHPVSTRQPPAAARGHAEHARLESVMRPLGREVASLECGRSQGV